MPTLSVIIPVLNGAKFLPKCLECLRQSTTPAVECIVVDDGSSDGSAAIAEAAGVKVLRTRGHAGPASGRNQGVAHASGDIVVFLDADVCVRPDTLARIRSRFENDPSIDALFGSYDDEPGDPGFVSQYKNLLHHYVHQSGHTEAVTFWSGCGAVRRAVFQAAGGFDQWYTRPSTEDVELGYRLRNAGRRIVLDPHIQVKHLKRWGLVELVRCDIVSRALPWTRLILQSSRLPNDLNLAVSQRLTAILVVASAIFALINPVIGISPAWALLPLAAAIWLNRKFYLFLAAKRGWFFLAGALPLHLAYYLYSTLAFAVGVFMHVLVWRRQTGRIHSPAARPSESVGWSGNPDVIVPQALDQRVEPDE